MRRRKTRYTLIHKYGEDILKSEKFQKQDEYIQHGNITVKQHCISVANASIKLAEHLHIKYQRRALIRGALLHDYFLYDWHLPHKENNWHGFRHANIALRNAINACPLQLIKMSVMKWIIFCNDSCDIHGVLLDCSVFQQNPRKTFVFPRPPAILTLGSASSRI